MTDSQKATPQMAFIFLTVLFDFYLVMKVKVCKKKKKKKLNFLHLSPREKSVSSAHGSGSTPLSVCDMKTDYTNA